LEIKYLLLYRTNVIARRFVPKQSPVLREFWSKADCHAATPALAGGAREEQERRLATLAPCASAV
jgi:hypothetical protein